MGISVQDIFNDKFKEIQSRLPIKMNTPQNSSVSFQEFLENASNSNNSSSSTSKPTYTKEIEDAVTSISAKYNVDANLIKAIIRAESGFNQYAESKAGAQGLMQLMPATARSLGVTNSFDIRQNIDGGTRYIKNKIDQYNGDVRLALAAYNAGPGSVSKYNGIPPYAETQNYIKNVLNYYQEYKNE